MFFVYTFQNLICVCHFTIWNNKQIFPIAFFKLYFPCSQRLIIFSIPICWLWAYTMNVIAETRRVHLTRYTFLFQFHLSTQALYVFKIVTYSCELHHLSKLTSSCWSLLSKVKGNHGLILGHRCVTSLLLVSIFCHWSLWFRWTLVNCRSITMLERYRNMMLLVRNCNIMLLVRLVDL